MLEHDLQYPRSINMECVKCRGFTSHALEGVREDFFQEYGKVVNVYRCRLCERQQAIPGGKFDTGELSQLVVKK